MKARPWWHELPGDAADPLRDHRLGMQTILNRVACRRWWTDPDHEDFPALGVQERMEYAAAWRLARGERPSSVARGLGRDWPQWKRLMPELVRAVLQAARAAQ